VRLWGRGKSVRQTALQLRNAFCEFPAIERLLVAETIADDVTANTLFFARASNLHQSHPADFAANSALPPPLTIPWREPQPTLKESRKRAVSKPEHIGDFRNRHIVV
jgi:hypothetical protein